MMNMLYSQRLHHHEKLSNASGLTLVSMLIGVSLSAFLLLGLSQLLQIVVKNYRYTTNINQLNDDARFAINYLNTQLSMSGYGMSTPTPLVAFPSGGAPQMALPGWKYIGCYLSPPGSVSGQFPTTAVGIPSSCASAATIQNLTNINFFGMQNGSQCLQPTPSGMTRSTLNATQADPYVNCVQACSNNSAYNCGAPSGLTFYQSCPNANWATTWTTTVISPPQTATLNIPIANSGSITGLALGICNYFRVTLKASSNPTTYTIPTQYGDCNNQLGGLCGALAIPVAYFPTFSTSYAVTAGDTLTLTATALTPWARLIYSTTQTPDLNAFPFFVVIYGTAQTTGGAIYERAIPYSFATLNDGATVNGQTSDSISFHITNPTGSPTPVTDCLGNPMTTNMLQNLQITTGSQIQCRQTAVSATPIVAGASLTYATNTPVLNSVEYMKVLLGESDYGDGSVSRYVAPNEATLDPSNIVSARIALVMATQDALLPIPASASAMNLMPGPGGTMMTYTPPNDGRIRKVFVTTVYFKNNNAQPYEKHCAAGGGGFYIRAGGVRNQNTWQSNDSCCAATPGNCYWYPTQTACEAAKNTIICSPYTVP